MSSDALRLIAPTGRLRVAVVVAAAPSPFFSCSEASGELRGVSVDLGRALATELDIPLELIGYPTSAEITAAGIAGKWDVSFMPRDAERETKFDFGPPYFVSRSTYLVPPRTQLRPPPTLAGFADTL
jgi:polar amino acid transport system substrate-binding protein